MKDNRFIELVNLYIDRQISDDEISELEAEMQANPRRRATYRQYCQMHRATTLVYESFRSDEAAQADGTDQTDAKIARFEISPRRRTPWLYYGAGVAAAGAALLFSITHSTSPGQPKLKDSPVSAPTPLQMAAVVAAPVESNATVPAAPTREYSSLLANVRRDDPSAFAAETMQSGKPSLFEDGVFDSQANTAIRAFRNKPSAAQQSEFAAFQFQR